MIDENKITAERMLELGGGFDPGAEAEELAGLPMDGKPTCRKRVIVRTLEEGALQSLGNLELAPRIAGAITTYDKGIRDDIVFNKGLRDQQRDIEKEKIDHANPKLSPEERERLITKLAHIFGKDPEPH